MKNLLLKIAYFIERKYGAPKEIDICNEILYHGRTYIVMSTGVDRDWGDPTANRVRITAVEKKGAKWP